MYDLIVIGGGSGGVAAARRAVEYGAKVLVVEKAEFGGTCVNLGCVPKKIFVYASEFQQFFKDAENYGWSVDVKKFEWSKLLENKNKEIDRLNRIYETLLEKANVDVVKGDATFINKTMVRVNNKSYSAKYILIASGGETIKPEIKGIEHAIFSDDAFFLKELPKKIVVIGGGYISLEFASIYNSLGCEVVVLVRGENILRNFDKESALFLQDEMEKKGVIFHFESEVDEVQKADNAYIVCSGNKEISADKVFVATGRKPNIEGLNLEKIGIKLGKREQIIVDEYSKTNIDNVYAVGDVTNRANLTPVAIQEGRAFSDSIFGNNIRKVSHENIPSVVFSQPNFGSIGLSEEEVIKKEIRAEIYTTNFRPMKNAISGNEERMFMKLIVEKSSQKILGIHIIGEQAGEILQGFAAAVICNATKADFDRTIAIHPTVAEELVTMKKPVREV